MKLNKQSRGVPVPLSRRHSAQWNGETFSWPSNVSHVKPFFGRVGILTDALLLSVAVALLLVTNPARSVLNEKGNFKIKAQFDSFIKKKRPWKRPILCTAKFPSFFCLIVHITRQNRLANFPSANCAFLVPAIQVLEEKPLRQKQQQSQQRPLNGLYTLTHTFTS